MEQGRSKGALTDLDCMLAGSEVRALKETFWGRCRFPAEVQPSDAAVSRTSRELSKRMLCIFHMTWVYWEWIPSKSSWSDSTSRLGVLWGC